jgi:hypothetical protein
MASRIVRNRFGRHVMHKIIILGSLGLDCLDTRQFFVKLFLIFAHSLDDNPGQDEV